MKISISYATLLSARHEIFAVIDAINKELPESHKIDTNTINEMFGDFKDIEKKWFTLKKKLTGVDIDINDEFLIEAVSLYGTLYVAIMPHVMALAKISNHYGKTTFTEFANRWIVDESVQQVASTTQPDETYTTGTYPLTFDNPVCNSCTIPGKQDMSKAVCSNCKDCPFPF